MVVSWHYIIIFFLCVSYFLIKNLIFPVFSYLMFSFWWVQRLVLHNSLLYQRLTSSSCNVSSKEWFSLWRRELHCPAFLTMEQMKEIGEGTVPSWRLQCYRNSSLIVFSFLFLSRVPDGEENIDRSFLSLSCYLTSGEFSSLIPSVIRAALTRQLFCYEKEAARMLDTWSQDGSIHSCESVSSILKVHRHASPFFSSSGGQRWGWVY